MSTVKIYKVTRTKAYMMSEQGTGFSLTPWGNNTPDYEGYDDGGKDYTLPDGFTVETGNDEQKHIYNTNNKCCELFSSKGHPAIMTDDPEPIILKLAKG